MSIMSPTPSVVEVPGFDEFEACRVRLTALRDQIDAARRQHDDLVDVLLSSVTEADVIVDYQHPVTACSARCTHRKWAIGDRGEGITCYEQGEPSHSRVSHDWVSGPIRTSSPYCWVDRGVFELVLVVPGLDSWSTEKLIFVKVADPVHGEPEYRRAIANLRGRAKTQSMRVRARDRAIELVDPMNTIVHAGDVVSASLWLIGFAAEVAK